MNNNMNENTKVTKDVEETKATEVEKRDISDVMGIINEVSFCSNKRIAIEKSKENIVQWNTKQNEIDDMFIKIRDVVYNDIIAKHDILCMTQSEYYEKICNKDNMNVVCHTEINRQCVKSIVNGLIHVDIPDGLSLCIFNCNDSELHASFILKPFVIKEDLDIFIYSYLLEIYSTRFFGRCILNHDDPHNIDDCIENTVNSIKKDLELVLRYTNARIEVLQDFYNAMLNVGKEYNNEDERLGFYHNCLQRLMDSDYGEIKPIYTDDSYIDIIDEHSCAGNMMISYFKTKPLVKLILERCNFTDIELLEYVQFINFNPAIKHIMSVMSSSDEFTRYLESLCDIMSHRDVNNICFKHSLQELIDKIKDWESK